MKEELIAKLQRLIKLHLPESYVSDYLNDPASLLALQNRQQAVMFADIRSFGSLSEGRLPEDLVLMLNSCFRVMADSRYGSVPCQGFQGGAEVLSDCPGTG